MPLTLKSTFATLPFTERGKPIVLGGDPKGKTILYTNTNSVVIRDIEDVTVADIYTQHSVKTTCAKYSPSRFYIASADVSGKVRIWDTVNKEHILKAEYRPISSSVYDLAWDADSKKIVVAGAGNDKFASVINVDTGTTVGEVSGTSKPINSCAYKPTRPYRIVIASEDHSLAVCAGPPFKFQCSKLNHERFVNCVRYSPNGEVFISGGADGKLFVFDGKGDTTTTDTMTDGVREIGSPAHKGQIYAICFNKDGSRLLSSGGDKMARIWDVQSGEMQIEFTFGSAIEDMQVSCLWQEDQLITLSLSGHINFLDEKNPTTPARIIKGHNKPITSLAVTLDRGYLLSSDSSGKICRWDVNTGASEVFIGKGHSNQIQSMGIHGNNVVTCGVDDTVICSSLKDMEFGKDEVKLNSQPKFLSVVKDELVVVACINHIEVIRSGKIVSSLPVSSYEPSSVSVHPGLTTVAVGGKTSKGGEVHIYTLSNDTLTEEKCISSRGDVTTITYSPDGSCLAVGEGTNSKCVTIYDVLNDYCEKVASAHRGRVMCLAWSPSSQFIASGSLDTNLQIWDVNDKFNKHTMEGAHRPSGINAVQWLGDNLVATAGQDSNIKIWSLDLGQ